MYAFTPSPAFFRRLPAKVTSCAALAFTSDFLFYDQRIGWTLGLFALGLLLALLLHQPHLTQGKAGRLLALAAMGLGLSMVEEPTFLAGGLYTATICWLVLLPKIDNRDIRHVLRMVAGYLFLTSISRLYDDSVFLMYVRKRLKKLHGTPYGSVLRWALPVLCGAVFTLLFAQANPVLTRLFMQIDLRFPEFSGGRVALWLGSIVFFWALLRPKLPRRAVIHAHRIMPSAQRFTLTGLLFNDQAVFTSLLLFNALFLMQNLMDVLFIWSGAPLPEGMSYAEYAHRGAYPLMFTALLAGVFILIAFKAGVAPGTHVRRLICLWICQNIFLVGSSIARLLGYIAEYQLTYLRIAALIWMSLVALGLLLIMARIGLQHSNRWLINRNALMLYATLYVCCFVNFGGIIAGYNLAPRTHDREARAPDMAYLERSVGIAAIPALFAAEASQQASPNACNVLLRLRSSLHMDDWRARTFRRYRISQVPVHGCLMVNQDASTLSSFSVVR